MYPCPAEKLLAADTGFTGLRCQRELPAIVWRPRQEGHGQGDSVDGTWPDHTYKLCACHVRKRTARMVSPRIAYCVLVAGWFLPLSRGHCRERRERIGLIQLFGVGGWVVS